MKKFLINVLFIVTVLTTYSQPFFSENTTIKVHQNNLIIQNPWAGGINSPQVSSIDLNLDGISDIILFDRADNTLLPFVYQPSSNTYKHNPSYSKSFPKLHDWVLLRDYDCDGKMDIFTYSTGGMAIYKNTATVASGLQFELVTPLLYSNYHPNAINLYVSSADIPAIDDIDGDGDLDILTFSILGKYMEYHKNLSKETYGTCDSLNFELRNKCWGYFSENGTSNSVSYPDTCPSNITNPAPEITAIKNNLINKHAGSTILTLDIDNNGNKELILGDISFKNLTLLTNGDQSIDLTLSNIIGQDVEFPKNHQATDAVDIDLFPAGYYVDVDNDNVKDLLAAPNCHSSCINTSSLWLYKNSGTNNAPIFSLTQKDFLQEDMIDHGEKTHPVFFDYNGDGLEDLIVGNYGVKQADGNYTSSLLLYENIGSTSQAEFKLIENDFLGLSTLPLNTGQNIPTIDLFPTFGDIDGDGDKDLLIGDYHGKIHLFTNTPSGTTAQFNLTTTDYLLIDVGNYAAPQLFDVNNDGLLDLAIGNSSGYITYYENQGASTNPLFIWKTDSLGKVCTNEWWSNHGASTPAFLKVNGVTHLIAGSENGHLYHYNNIDGNLENDFTLTDTTFQSIWHGKFSSPTIANINNDGLLDLFIGNLRGGIGAYFGSSTNSISTKKAPITPFEIYPNPAKNTIKLSNASDTPFSFALLNNLGETILLSENNLRNSSINISNISNGYYTIVIIQEENTYFEKIIVRK